MTPQVFSADMKPLRLGRRIGKGGEGEVYTLEGNSEQVVKFYTVAEKASREAKIRKMIEDGLANITPLIAFPIALVRDKTGAFAGFTMAKISGHYPLHELYAPGARKAAFPNADYRFLVRSATNIARAVGSAHHSRCVIGDINHSGILVSEDGRAALIDADSFQISDGPTRHDCRVGTPDYTPPELQGRKLQGVLRTPIHDAFGLAVVIFQLLWMGRHPYSGKYSKGELPLERAISEFRFAYSMRATGMAPPPAVPGLQDFPPGIAAAFEQAFGPEGPIVRPAAKQWIGLLQELETSLVKCARSPLHFYPGQAPECPWCRTERVFGAQLFAPIHAGSGDNAWLGTAKDIATIWREIESVQRPGGGSASPLWQAQRVVAPSKRAIAAASSRLHYRLLGVVLFIMAAIFYFVMPTYVLFCGTAAGLGVHCLVLTPASSRKIRRRAREIEARWQAQQDCKSRGGIRDFDLLYRGLGKLKTEYDSLGAEQQRLVRACQADQAAIKRIESDMETRATQIRAALGNGAERLRKLAQEIERSQAAVDPGLRQLSEQRAQALADMRYLKMWSAAANLPAPAATNATVRLRPTITAAQCPRCGSPMLTRSSGRNRGASAGFLKCSRYPSCGGMRAMPLAANGVLP